MEMETQNIEDEREAFGLQVAGGAHHLNNIFAQVLLNAELLDRSNLDETGVEMLDSIVEGVHAAIRVVDLLAQQSSLHLGEPVAVDLKYVVKGFQKRRETFFPDGVVINAQYPHDLRVAWARPAPLFRSVLALCRLSAAQAPERQALFLQVRDVDLESGAAGVAVEIAAPAHLVEEGSDLTEAQELAEIVADARESGGEVSVTESATGATLVRFAFPVPPEQDD
jgi:hypothetical protein